MGFDGIAIRLKWTNTNTFEVVIVITIMELSRLVVGSFRVGFDFGNVFKG